MHTLNILDGVWGLRHTASWSNNSPPTQWGLSSFPTVGLKRGILWRWKRHFPLSTSHFGLCTSKFVCWETQRDIQSMAHASPASHASWFFKSRQWSRKYCFWLPSSQEPSGASSITLDWSFLCCKFTAFFIRVFRKPSRESTRTLMTFFLRSVLISLMLRLIVSLRRQWTGWLPYALS